jgi:hypothetical protein
MTSSPVARSRLPVGSSARITAGCMMVARAMATRWRCPPESWSGTVVGAVLQAVGGAAFAPIRFWRVGAGGMPARIIGRATFSAAVSRGTRWKLWKTKPMRSLRDSRLLFGREGGDVAALEVVGAGIGAVEQAEQVEEGRFPRAGRVPSPRRTRRRRSLRSTACAARARRCRRAEKRARCRRVRFAPRSLLDMKVASATHEAPFSPGGRRVGVRRGIQGACSLPGERFRRASRNAHCK